MFNSFITLVNGVVDAVKAALQAMFSRSRRQSGAGPEDARFRLPPSGRITTKSAHDYEGSAPLPPQSSPMPRPPQPAPHATEPEFSPAPIPEAVSDEAELEMPISPAPARRRPPVKEAPASVEPRPAAPHSTEPEMPISPAPVRRRPPVEEAAVSLEPTPAAEPEDPAAEPGSAMSEPPESAGGFETAPPASEAEAPKMAAPPPESAGGPEAAPPPSAAPEPRPVLLGGSAPHRARPGDWILVQFAAYVAGFEPEAQRLLEREAKPGEVRLGEETDCRWAVGARVTVRCAVRGLDVPAQTESFTWDGECRTVSFDIEIPQNAKPRDTVIVMEAFVHDKKDAPDAVQVGRLRMTLEIGGEGDDGEPQKVKGEAARTAFASYASADRLDVLERASSIRRSAGIEVKVDVLFLEMGEKWNEELLKEIEACDKLMLFWSEHTSKSKWVEWEWKHAVETKGEDVLELHLLRHTPIDQVPEELRKYHFNDVYLLARDAELYRREQAAKAAAAGTPRQAGNRGFVRFGASAAARWYGCGGAAILCARHPPHHRSARVNILVLNVGSSSLKFQLMDTDAERMKDNTDRRLARGQIERIGGEAVWSFRAGDAPAVKGSASLKDHRAAVEYLLAWIVADDSDVEIHSLAEIGAAGHRVVHGGEHFVHSVAIDDAVMRGIEETIELAPLHNPANLKGVQAVRAVLGPAVPQVAVFDTAFHHTLPERAFLYAIPYSLYRRHRVRRYGFHGTSHRYVSYRWRQITGTPREAQKIITLHLGNGCSACAIRGGESIDTSMGFTPLEGLVMGTRSGDLDPALLDYIAEKEGLNLAGVETLLNKQSGLLGISGLTNDMRELLAEAEEHDDRRAWLAIEIFCYRVRKYIGGYLAAMGGADAICFAGGIGENAPAVRAMICEEMEWAGIRLDPAANHACNGVEARISAEGAKPEVWVIPTDEELLIARDTFRVVNGLETRY